MEEVFNVGETILLDGEPLSLAPPAGVEAWIEQSPTQLPLRPGPRSAQRPDKIPLSESRQCIFFGRLLQKRVGPGCSLT